MTKSLVILYGDIDFDGRVKRMVEVADKLGETFIVDASANSHSTFARQGHSRIQLNPRWSVIRKHLTFWLKVVIEARRQKPDIIFAEDFFTTFPSWLASRLVGAKLIYDAHELIVPEKGKEKSFRGKLWYGLEKFVAPRADLVIAANEERAKVMQQHYSLATSPTYMRNIPPFKAVSNEEKEAAIKAYSCLSNKKKNDCILIYQGNMSMSRGILRFVEVLDYLPTNYRLVFAGDGPDLKALIKYARKHIRSGRVSILGRVSNEILPSVTSCCDIGVVTYPFKGLNNIYCAPNKVFEYALAGLSIIASSQPPLQKLSEESCFIETFSEHSSPQEIAVMIIGLNTESKSCNNSIRAFVDKYNCESERYRVVADIEEI